MEGVDYLAYERNKAEFDVEAMKIVWAGSAHAFEVSDRISKLVANDPAFRKDDRSMLPRKELFKNTLRKARKRILDLRLLVILDVMLSADSVTEVGNPATPASIRP